MNITRKCNYISNSYYNMALEMAKERNLSDAAEYLKRSLQFNKTNTDARNVLGLIYNEIGEVGDALVQWIISLNLNPENNPASRYIDELHGNQTLFDRSSSILVKFNQTLSMTKGGADDLAIIQLQKIVEVVPNFVKAQLLLACLYMTQEKWNKALKCLQQIQRLDRGNPKAIQYISYIRSITGKAEKIKKKDTIATENRNLGEDGLLVNSNYKEATVFQTIVNIALGLAIGAAAMLFLYLPTRIAKITEESNQSVVVISEKLNEANKTIQQLTDQYNNLENEYQEVLGVLDGSDEVVANKVLQYQLLAASVNHMRKDEILLAAEAYAKIDPELLTDNKNEEGISSVAVYNELKAYMTDSGVERVLVEGDINYEAQNYEEALRYYQLATKIVPGYGVARYKEGRATAALGDREKAVAIWTEVIQNNSGTEIAELAKKERGY